MSLIPHQHSRAPEVQTTGDTTPVQQVVYAVSLTTSGGSNAWDGTELRQKGCGCGFSAVTVTGPVTPLSAFHFSICSSNDLRDFSTVRSLLTPSMVSENETHCVCAAAIVQGVLQQTTAVSTMVGRTYSHHPRSGFPLKAKEPPKKLSPKAWCASALSEQHKWPSGKRRSGNTQPVYMPLFRRNFRAGLPPSLTYEHRSPVFCGPDLPPWAPARARQGVYS